MKRPKTKGDPLKSHLVTDAFDQILKDVTFILSLLPDVGSDQLNFNYSGKPSKNKGYFLYFERKYYQVS